MKVVWGFLLDMLLLDASVVLVVSVPDVLLLLRHLSALVAELKVRCRPLALSLCVCSLGILIVLLAH